MSTFSTVAEFGVSTVTDRIRCRHLRTGSGTERRVTGYDVVYNGADFKSDDVPLNLGKYKDFPGFP
jgi:hypothetical protein